MPNSRWRPRPRIETRLAAAGLPPLPRTAWLEVDLDALAANLGAIRAEVGRSVRVEPVVKADAYGHGAVPVALALERGGADGLSVATYDEAAELRAGGVMLPILVLYPVPPEVVADAARTRVAVTCAAGPLLARTLTAAREASAAGAPALDVHLEIETGLGRGGALLPDVAGAVAAIAATPGARLAGLWTHLASSEDRAVATAQDRAFSGALAGLADAVSWNGADAPHRHVAASGGVLGAVVGRHDAVRVGLSVYGLVPDAFAAPPGAASLAAALRPAMALHARPVRVVDLPAGHGVSYGPSFVTSRPSRIATLPLGYGDGWRRVLTDRSEALVRGTRVPLVGRVSMDAVMADVTDVVGSPVDEDDEFALLGAQGPERITAFDLARSSTTISYEVVTAMARRLPRVYHAAGSPVGLRTLAGGRSMWHASSSGTATSATSRSTPS